MKMQRPTVNAENGRRSKGRKSPLGKSRSARNSRTHGLSSADHQENLLSDNLERLVIAVDNCLGGALGGTEGRRFILAEQLLNQTQRARNTFIVAFLEAVDRLDIPAGTDVLAGLERLERYERRALARRRFAIRDLIRCCENAGRTAASHVLQRFLQNEAKYVRKINGDGD